MDWAKMHWFSRTLALTLWVALGPLSPSVATATLPEALTVKLGKDTILGWKDEADANRRVLATSADRTSVVKEAFAKRGIEMPEEGFLFAPNDENDESFTVRAWSAKGRGNQLLKAVEVALADSIRAERLVSKQEDPAGFAYKNRSGSFLRSEKKRKAVARMERSRARTMKTPITLAIAQPAEAVVPRIDRMPALVLWMLLILVVVPLLAFSAGVMAARR